MEFGIQIIVNHLTLTPAETARALEERGFDALFLGEHTHIPAKRETPYIGLVDREPPRPGENPDELRKRRPDLRPNFWYLYDPFIALASAASVTERIKLGTAICLIPERDPITLAQEVATLDQISNGRVILGIGSGWNREEMANHGVDFKDRFKVTRERVEAMKVLWTEQEAEYHGEHVDFDPVWSYPKPVQEGGPPILLGQNGRRTFERIVRYCDGWLPNRRVYRDTNMIERIGELQRLWAEAGRDPAKLQTTVTLPPIPDDPAVIEETADEIEQYRDAGVYRVVINAGAPKRDLGPPTFDRCGELLKRVK